MKKFTQKSICTFLAILLILTSVPICSFAVSNINAYVSIADKNGKLVVADEYITISDTDKDGAITMSDALYCAHDEFYSGGAKKGYSAVESQFGLSLMKLWGTSNGGSYGYYLNDKSSFSLADKIKDGDRVYAFIYTDTMNFSDAYSFFEEKISEFKSYTFHEFTLYKYTFDANWNTVKTPVEGAVITIDGEDSKYVTDENGKAKIAVLRSGDHVISAHTADGTIITPPVCRVNVSKGSFVDILAYIMAVVIAYFKSRK